MTHETVAVPADVLKTFADIFKSYELADEVARSLTCSEADALAAMIQVAMFATGTTIAVAEETREAWLVAHAASDDEEDSHYGYGA